MERLILSIGRQPMQRSTTYGAVAREREQTSRSAAPLAPMVQTAPRKRVLLAGD
jgi:FO synthase